MPAGASVAATGTAWPSDEDGGQADERVEGPMASGARAAVLAIAAIAAALPTAASEEAWYSPKKET